jgi:hypothetical protein
MLDKLKALKTLIPDTGKKLLAWLLVAGAIYAANKYLGSEFPTPPLPLDNPAFKTADGHNFGWRADPEAVQAVAATLDFKVFADTPAGQQIKDPPSAFYQWDVYRKADPRGPPAKNQGSVGSCVSFGTNNAILRTMACQIALGGANEELKDIAEEVTYAGSRVEIGGGRIRGDGSVGAWAAKFVQKYGVVSREVHGKYDLTKYDTSRCRSWGQSGVPDDLEPIAREHPVKDITLVKSLDELKLALSQGYGVAVCSDQGFSMQRDSRGVARASGSWAHCMCIDGYHTDENGRLFFHIENSWGDGSHKGPVGWGNPSTAGFWAEAATVQRMLNAGDTWAFSSVRGFPRRESDWFVRANNIRERADGRLAAVNLRRSCNPCDLFSLCP